MFAVVQSWASEDPASAAEWVSGHAAPAAREGAIGAVAQQWFVKDPAAAAEWAAGLPDEQERQQAAAILEDLRRQVDVRL